MDINKKFEELYEEYEKEWHEGHEPQGGHDHYEDIGDVEELEEARTYLDEKFAGWIAFYNKQKLEIKPKKGEIDSLYDAKQAAIKHFKVPKSKQGLLAIKPAQEEARSYIDAKKKEKEKKDYKKKYGREPFSFSGKHMSRKHSMGLAAEFDPKVDESKQDAFVVRYTGKDRKRYAVPYKSQKDADKKAKELKSDGASQVEVEKITLMGFVKFKEEDEAYGGTAKKKKSQKILKSKGYFHRKDKPAGWVEEDYDKNQLLRVKHDEALIAETGDICALSKKDLRSKSMQKVYDKKCSPAMLKKKKSIFGKIGQELDLYNQNSIGENKMKNLIDASRKILMGEGDGDEAEYQKKRKAVAKKFGVESCSALKDVEKRKECYNALDKAHVADHEEQVELEKMKKEGVGELSDKELKDKMKNASTQKETDAACGEMGKRRLKMEKKKVTEKTISKLFAHVRNLMKK